jgi:glycosyltransferase-like protein
MLPIGLLTYSTKPRGSVVHAACLAEALTRLGADTTLYALSKQGDGFFREVAARLVLLPAGPAPSESDALIRQRIAEMAAGLSALGVRGALYHAEDCLAANGLQSARHVLRPALNVRTVHHVERFESPYLAECQRKSVLGADRLLVVSRSTERDVLAEFGRRSQVISNGVALERFASRDHERERELRTRLGVGRDDLLVLSVGGVEPRKNSLAALEAVAGVLQSVPGLCWVIAGGSSIFDHSSHDQAFERRLRELGPSVSARVKRLGTVDEAALTLLYQASDLLFCPSIQEGFGLCVLEAMAAGTPVVVSEREPFTDWLPAASARFVDPTSAASLGAGLLALAADAVERRRLAREGHAVAERFTWDRVAEAHLVEYEAALRSRPAAATVSAEY